MKKTYNKAFTLIELLVVITILSFVIIVIIQFGANKVIEGSAIDRLTYNSIRYDINNALRNATNGYGGISLGESMKDEKTLLPEDFMVLFRSSLENDNNSGYYYLIETQTRENNNIKYQRIINKTKREYASAVMFLKEIRMKTDENDSGVLVNSFAVSFKNPTGKTSFYINDTSFLGEGVTILPEDSGHTIFEMIKPLENTSYNIAELVFYTNGGEERFIQKIYKDKRFPISIK